MNKDHIDNSLFRLNPLPSWIYDFESLEILDVNIAAIEHYGYSEEEFLGLTLKDLRPSKEVPELISALTDIKRREGNIHFGIFTHQKKNGDLIRMEINGHKVDFHDRPGMLVVCQDVTEKENHLLQLQASEAKLKTATSIAKLGYWSLDTKSNTLSWSDEVFDIWGVERDAFELRYDRFFKTIHPDDREAFTIEHSASSAGEKNHDFVHRIIRPDGSIRWVHELGRLVKDQDGKALSFEGTVQDITAQKEEEQRLKLLESVVTNTNDAIIITEAEPQKEPGPKIIYVNDAFTEMTGYTFEEVVGKSPRFLQGPNSNYAELKRMRKAMRNFEPCEITTINYKKNGDEFWIHISISPVADEKGWYTHWIAIERDVTEQKQKELEKELLGKISLDFFFKNDLLDSCTALCQTVSDYGRFDFVELWLPNIEKTEIQLIAKKPASSQADIFYKRTEGIRTFQRGEGLQGVVWDKKTTILWKNIGKKDDFVRKEAAEKAGINSALGIPLFFNENIVGVLVVATRFGLSYLQKYVKLFEKFEHFVGSEIYRNRLENDLSHLYDAIPDLICTTDLQGRFLKINKAGCDLIGLGEEEILYTTFEEFVHPDDKDSSRKDLENLKKGRKTYGFENRYINKNGDIIWLSWTSNSNLHEGLIYATARNITEEKRLRELNRQASKLAKIGSWEVNLVKSKTFWSEITHEIHETDPKTFNPDFKAAINLYREDFRAVVNEEVAKCIEQGIPFDLEAIIVTAKQNERWVRVIGHPEVLDGKCQRIYGSFQDIHERKIVEIQKNSLLGTLENSLNEIYIFDSETLQFSYVNKGALLNIGYSEHEIKTLTPVDLKPEFATALFKQLVTPLVNGEKEKIVFFTNHKRKNGGLYPVEVHLQLASDGHNKNFLAIILDITERKKAEEELQKAYEEKNNILESIGDAFFAVDKNWIITYCNKEAENLIDRKREGLIGNNLWDLFPNAVESDFYRAYHKAMESGEKTIVEDYYPAVNKWFEVTVYPSNEGLSIYFKDITLKKEADIRLLQANERFEKVTQATSDAIWDWDISKDTFYRSQNTQNFFGKSAATELSSKDFWNDSFHPDDVEKIKESLATALQNPKENRWESEYKIYSESGEIVHVIDRGLIIRDSNGKPIRMIGAMTDITLRKNQEEQLVALNESLQSYAMDLERSNEELESFAFITSHDLQEPLRMVSSFMDQLERKYGDQLDDKALQYIHFASDGAKRMKQIILDLLEYSRAGRPTDAPEKVDLNEILAEFQRLRRKIISEKAVHIVADELPVIDSYKVAITQILHSLLDNAIKYSKEGIAPHIEIHASESDDVWRFAVKDNGIGIESEFNDQIFIIFQRLHNKSEYDGTGIGLPIAKKHVEFLGGEIWVDSTPGEGSTFNFTIPRRR